MDITIFCKNKRTIAKITAQQYFNSLTTNFISLAK
jgi:hypothetical protein